MQRINSSFRRRTGGGRVRRLTALEMMVLLVPVLLA
jgi:hypothetical protein